MKILSKQPVPEPAPEAGDEAAIDARDDAYELGGWSTGAQANTTTLVRWVAWAAICGSILLSLGTALSRPADTPSTDQQPPALHRRPGRGGLRDPLRLRVPPRRERGRGRLRPPTTPAPPRCGSRARAVASHPVSSR